MLKRHALIAFVSIFLLSISSEMALAQVYVWKDPETGATRMSNARPSWFRSDAGTKGPRTQMFIDGKLVDDTEVAATPEQQSAARTQVDQARVRQAEQERNQQLRATEARDTATERQRQARIDSLLRQRSELMFKIAGGPTVAGSSPFDVGAVTNAKNQLAQVNRELNALDPQGASARGDQQKRGLGAAAETRKRQADDVRRREEVRGAVRDAVRDCMRGSIGCP